MQHVQNPFLVSSDCGLGEISTKTGFIFFCPDNWTFWKQYLSSSGFPLWRQQYFTMKFLEAKKKMHLKTIFHFCGGGVGEILTKSGFIFLCPDNWNRWLAQFIAINVISWRGAKNFKSEIYRFFAVWHVTFSKKQWPSIFKLIINETLKNRVILNIMQCEHFYKWLQLK